MTNVSHYSSVCFDIGKKLKHTCHDNALSNWKDGCLQGNESDSRGVKREKIKQILTDTISARVRARQRGTSIWTPVQYAAERSSAVKLEPTLSRETPALHTVHLSLVDLPEKSQSCPSLSRWGMSVMQSELKERRWGHLWMLCIKRCQDLYFFHGRMVWRGSDFCTLLVLRFDRVLVHTQSCLIVCSNTVPHCLFSVWERYSLCMMYENKYTG